ncbi:MAG: tRNA lysidine(34) synthetase TilS, partial [Acetatifactor sp.]|nr:tRNA lysidine(34) synthetase TilS [Acetatifactor sp.]
MNEQYYELEQRVMAYCGAHRLFTPGDGVVLGVSGGADSVCLLFALHRLRQELGIELYVVHVNHGIRPDAAGDASYVEELCRRLEVPFVLVEEDVQVLARRLGCSTEEAGRLVRYEAFDRERERRQAQKIAVAHNAGDRAETMLLNLFRGSGLTGLGSIRPVRGRIVRPLLGLQRREIEAYLEQRRISCCQDSTNDTDAYTRNRIRRHILPYAEREICSGATAHLCRSADIFMEIEDYMEEQIRQTDRLCVTREGSRGKNATSRLSIGSAAFGNLHPAIQKGLLLSVLKELSPAHKDMGAGQVEQVLALCMQ